MEIKFLQGKGIVEGHLIGGCMDTLEILKGTSLWPNNKYWEGAILFLETSEEKPSIDLVTYWLRNYGAQGILQKLKAIIFAIPGGDISFDDKEYDEKLKNHLNTFEMYDEALIKVAKEFGREDIPIISHLNFGHTAPMLTIPFGAIMEINIWGKTVRIKDSGVIEKK